MARIFAMSRPRSFLCRLFPRPSTNYRAVVWARRLYVTRTLLPFGLIERIAAFGLDYKPPSAMPLPLLRAISLASYPAPGVWGPCTFGGVFFFLFLELRRWVITKMPTTKGNKFKAIWFAVNSNSNSRKRTCLLEYQTCVHDAATERYGLSMEQTPVEAFLLALPRWQPFEVQLIKLCVART